MRARLLFTVMVLMAMVLVGLGVPLALIDARNEEQRLFLDRLNDTTRFASLAQRALIEANPDSLSAELARYDQVYGVTAVVVARSGEVVAQSRRDLVVLDHDRIGLALAGQRSEPYPLLLPWNAEPVLLAEPILVDGEVRGAAVTISPTDRLRSGVLVDWILLLAAGVIALALAVLAALPVVQWILRPVQRLDEGTGAVAAAVLAGRDAPPVSDDRGPPELRRLSRSFDRMAVTVGQVLTAQRAFVADASHQLRNPLTALRLRLHNLDGQSGTVNGEDQAAALEEVDRLSGVLDGLLALARAENAAAVIVRVELDGLLGDRIEAWQVLAVHEGLALYQEGASGLAVRVQIGGLEAALDAVLDNAVKFSPPGGRIRVSTRRVEQWVEIAVRDCGPGMAPDELDRATARFWRSPAHHNVDGSGLGLAIALRTVERSGGKLLLELPDVGGLRVVIRLPADVDREPAPPVE